jgi:hypothetical protein
VAALPSDVTYNSSQGVYYQGGKLFNPLTGEANLVMSPDAAQSAASQYNQAQQSSQQSAADAKAAQDKADTVAFLQDQGSQLKDLLGRTDTSLSQGLQANEDNYNTGVNQTQDSATKQLQTEQGNKQAALDRIRSNAGQAYRSLAQIIGRAAGTSSSAFQELLPHAVGSDTSSKTQAASTTYGTNVSNINDSLTNALRDLLKQKNDNESNVRQTVEQKRQSINEQLATNAGNIAQAQGGGYAAVKAGEQPFMDAITASRNAVDNLFPTFHTAFTPEAVNPNLDQYTTDRSVINAQASGDQNPTDPYTTLLRRKLQGAA